MYITVIDLELSDVWQYKLPDNIDNWEHEDYEEFVRIDKDHSSSCDWMVHVNPGIKTEY